MSKGRNNKNYEGNLNLNAGDVVGFEIKNHKAMITKIAPFDSKYHQALLNTLSEWNSPSDDEAYNDL